MTFSEFLDEVVKFGRVDVEQPSLNHIRRYRGHDQILHFASFRLRGIEIELTNEVDQNCIYMNVCMSLHGFNPCPEINKIAQVIKFVG